GLADSLAALQATGAHPTRLMAIGGGARSRTWLQIIATALDVTLTLPADGEFGAALGAARLGMVAAGEGEVDQVMTAPDVTDEIAPDPALRGAFDAALQGFRAAYPAIRAVQ
ncbi:xylulokinase, partial [Paracoccus liaowanqingii]